MVTSSTKEVCVVHDSIFSEYGLSKELVTDKDCVTQLLNLKSFASQGLWNIPHVLPSIILVMDTLK